MSLLTTVRPGRGSQDAALGRHSSIRLPLVVMALAAVGAALGTVAIEKIDGIADVPTATPMPPAPAIGAASGDTSVPAASAVFAGREEAIEAPPPTF